MRKRAKICLRSVKQQSSNVGLARQWLEIWQPAENSQEAAFIFEDDIEVRNTYARNVPCTTLLR
jgi:hypothetical protein